MRTGESLDLLICFYVEFANRALFFCFFFCFITIIIASITINLAIIIDVVSVIAGIGTIIIIATYSNYNITVIAAAVRCAVIAYGSGDVNNLLCRQSGRR